MLQRVRAENGVVHYRSPKLSAVGVPHAFSTRIGGISLAPFDSLNLGNPGGEAVQDDSDRIAANYAKLHEAIGCGRRARLFVHQVHGADVLGAWQANSAFENNRCADAIVSDDPAKVLAVRTADCVPILLASSDGSRVGAVHAGWRGVVADVIPTALKGIGCRAGELVAAIGPCIGIDAFEVGGEVADAFRARFGAGAPIRVAANGKAHVDLRAAVRSQLVAAGVSGDRIDISDQCTSANAAEFFSHRRDRGITGRMAALIGARATAIHD